MTHGADRTVTDLRAGEHEVVLRRMNGARRARDWWDDTPAWAWDDLRFREREDRAWGCWLAGEAAYRLGALHSQGVVRARGQRTR